ncbi:MAG TPA: hypothetical protein VKZ52_05910, partial [Burkholderiaceae bacterium]|nr:hypothetical protein [Burkholderiaceae bacterium]
RIQRPYITDRHAETVKYVVKMRHFVDMACYTLAAPTLERRHETYWFVDKPLRAQNTCRAG